MESPLGANRSSAGGPTDAVELGAPDAQGPVPNADGSSPSSGADLTTPARGMDTPWRWVTPDDPEWPSAVDLGDARVDDNPGGAPPRGPTEADSATEPPRRNRQAVGLVATCVAVALLAGVAVARVGTVFRHAPRPTLGSQVAFPPPTVPAAPGGGPFAAAPPPAPSGNAAATGAAVTRGVVDITTTLAFENGSSAGTGMVLSPTGEVLTNNHVIAGSSAIAVQVAGTGPTYRATVVGTDATHDVAVLRLQGAAGLATVQTADSSTVTVGDAVTAVGNALGQQGPPAVVTGSVRAIDQTITVTDPATGDQQLSGLIQTDASLQPGDSGGPMLNSRGQVIGMNTAASAGRRFRQRAPEGFAIPITQALAIAKEIEAGRSSTTVQIGAPALLGVELVSVADAGSGSFGSYQPPAPSGAVVARVQPATPAARAGLAAGDEIVSFDKQSVDSPARLRSLLGAHRPGQRAPVRWLDAAGQPHDAIVELAAGPPQ